MKLTDVLTILGRVSAVSVVFALLSPAAELTGLSADADAIVVGTVASRNESATNVAFDISVEKIFKGDPGLKVIHVSHQWTRKLFIVDAPKDGSAQTMTAFLRGIWFLKRTNSSDWDMLPANGPDGIIVSFYWPAASTVPASYRIPATPSLVDTLVLEVAAGMESNRGRPESVFELLRSVHTSAAQTVFKNYLSSADSAFQAIGLAGTIIQQAEPDPLAELARRWPSISNEPKRVYVVSALRDSFRDSRPTAVKQLTAIAEASSVYPELRPAAVNALAWIHTKEALPFLASLLRSPDDDERMKGVIGLSAFANGCPVQSPDNSVSMEYLQFKNPSRYRTAETMAKFAFRRGPADQETDLVSFWLDWWRQNSASLQ